LQLKMSKTSFSSFVQRHVGPSSYEIDKMCNYLGFTSLDNFINKAVPGSIRSDFYLNLSRFSKGLSEEDALTKLKNLAQKNKVFRSYIGMGYYNTFTPTVIARNIFENPGWYTQYTPYQPEISQGRLEALLNFQTMVASLTSMDVANASLLDEGTALAEAIAMAYTIRGSSERNEVTVLKGVHPQSLAVLKSRAYPLGIEISEMEHSELEFKKLLKSFAVVLQYPDTYGEVKENDLKHILDQFDLTDKPLSIFSTDLLALTLLTPPGELGADIVVGSSQRFGVPLGFGGPHAAFIATKDEFKRKLPGRIVGISKDRNGQPALRLSLQTREQHIRREKATSNICTAQVLLAVMAGMYAVYHGPAGLKEIASKIHSKTLQLAIALSQGGYELINSTYFDTLTVKSTCEKLSKIKARALEKEINFNYLNSSTVSLSLDETVTNSDLADIYYVFDLSNNTHHSIDQNIAIESAIPNNLRRKSEFLNFPVFNSYHSETEFLRYVKRLEAKDLSLCQAMIPLGSCTMKLNSTTEMLGVSFREFSALHPFAPLDQAKGYLELISDLELALAEITGFAATSLQPNAGSQGELAGLLAIKSYYESKGEFLRDICLIPKSAHGTNPASAVMSGMKVVVVECNELGDIDINDLRSKVERYSNNLAALMVTYPSTHGVFEEEIKYITDLIHKNGGQVYMDGANLNALVGIVSPSLLGMDVCHINLHKTFCIPHGGGGPGVGPIAVKEHLVPFLPSTDFKEASIKEEYYKEPVLKSNPFISAAPFGSASILPISWTYLAMMGSEGVAYATKVAILSANYIAKKINSEFPVLFANKEGFVAHECIIDLRGLKSLGIEVDDVAKRLIDYSFHAPTVSWPVPGTMMIEPTESESLKELDRFCKAMIAIYHEAQAIKADPKLKGNNLLTNAPHTTYDLAVEEWERPYSREKAIFPLPELKKHKFWPQVARIDSAYGDRNLVCSCPDLSAYEIND
jgi:glycine dehydrogenase